MQSSSVAVFARYPSPGKVKTRLAATIGDRAACSFYKNCTESVLSELLQCPYPCISITHQPVFCKYRCADTEVHLFVAEVDELAQMETWMTEKGMSIKVMGQLQSENLGDRIFHSLKSLQLSGYSKVAAVATDIPDITHSIIRQAFELLDTYDIVLGPAVDGGFYFLGVKELTKELFDDVEWSTSSVYQKMVTNAEKLQWTIAPATSLPPIADIDTFHDLCSWVGLPCESDVESIVKASLEKIAQTENP